MIEIVEAVDGQVTDPNDDEGYEESFPPISKIATAEKGDGTHRSYIAQDAEDRARL
jgi:hypothetical protein